MRFCKPYISKVPTIEDVIESGWVSNSKNVEKLEEEFRNRFDVKYAVACSSATQGLVIAIKAAGIKEMLVGLPAFTWPSTLYAVQCNNNIPVFLDINRETWLVDYLSLSSPIDVLLAVDTFGNSFGKREYGIPVIIDAAHSFGVRDLGHRGLIEVVSLSHSKVVTAMEGGMILTNNDDFIEEIFELRRLSSRMGEINARVALQSISDYDGYAEVDRLRMVNKYLEKLDFHYFLQSVPYSNNYSNFSILLETKEKRDFLSKKLTELNYEYKVYYTPLSDSNHLVNTKYIYDRIITFPLYYEFCDIQDEFISQVNSIISRFK